MKPAITAAAVLLCVIVGVAMYMTSANQQINDPPPPPSRSTASQPADTTDRDSPPSARGADFAGSSEATTTGAGGDASAEPQQAPIDTSSADNAANSDDPTQLTTPLRVRPNEAQQTRVLGSTDPDGDYLMRIELTAWGAGIRRITLADYDVTVDGDKPYLIMHELDRERFPSPPTRSPFAARAVVVNGNRVPLESIAWSPTPVERTEAGTTVTYTAEIEDANAQPILRLTRTYRLLRQGYDVHLDQNVENLTDGSLNVQWQQNIQGDLNQDPAAYLGDRRTYAAGYFDNQYDPSRFGISIENSLFFRQTIIDRGGIWPNPDLTGDVELAWLASENRYFAIVAHRQLDGVTETGQVPTLESQFPDFGATIFPDNPNLEEQARAMVFTVATDEMSLAPGATQDLGLAFYAGPRKSEIFAQAPYDTLQLGKLIRYELGCTMCTFQWLAKGLLGFLKIVHNITYDWGVAIILLVVVVRLLLHPITKRAQANMMKMGKQMQQLQPEMEKLKTKYKDDQQTLNREMMKLYREKGVNPANALGCLPMFLQMPIWVALYAMLYFAIELRHEPAFWGFFQLFGDWAFLADLSSPDNFIVIFDEPVNFPLLFINLNFQSINILPLLMAVVFYFQQKFTTPPAANEQAAQQQKIMKFMVLLFPIFLYGAPSGLTLYIFTSTAAGVLDSYIVRQHVKKQEESGELFKKKEVKPGGFRDKMQKYMEQKQQELEAAQNQGKASKQVKSTSRSKGGKGKGKGNSR